MSVQRTPPRAEVSLLRPPTTSTITQHYNSDSALNKPMNAPPEDTYFSVTKRQKRNYVNDFEQPLSPVSNLKVLISELKEQQENKFDDLNSALLMIVAQNQDIQKSISMLTMQNENLQVELKQLKQENNDFKQKVSTLENQLEQMELKCCKTMIEIRNLPKAENENKKDLTTIVQNIGKTTGLETPLKDCDIKDIYRRKSNAVVVDFTSVPRKEAVMSCYKKYNRSQRDNKGKPLQTAHINLAGPSRPIYISEFLTTRTKRLFFLARETLKNKNIAACWTVHGKVYIKTEENATPIRINSESEL